MTWKNKLGQWLFPRLAPSRHVLDHVRLEINAWWARMRLRLHPRYRKLVRQLKSQRDLMVNVGCGPFGLPGWVNLDLFQHPNLTLATDCRRSLPLADQSCAGIHVEHFFEHLEHRHECPAFLHECYRCLSPTGVVRIIVPDAGMYARAYAEPGWEGMNRIMLGESKPEDVFRFKMDVLNWVFHQGSEHYGGYDAELLEHVLREAGFSRVKQCAWREGDFPGGPIDRELHRPYSLYFEAKR